MLSHGPCGEETPQDNETHPSRCDACDRFVWYPDERCAACGGELTWHPVSGDATLFSWAVLRRAFLPAFAEQVPFVTALVAIDEDPSVRIPTYLVDADPDSLRADEPVRVTFRPLSFPTVPNKSVIVPMFEKVKS